MIKKKMKKYFIPLSILFMLVAGMRYRLPTDVKPLVYTITIHPDLDNGIFKGKVSIHVKVKCFTESIALHSSSLNITSLFLNTKLVGHISDFSNSTYFYTFSDHELLVIQRSDKKKISPGNYLMNIEYSGEFSTSDVGFIKATFTENNTIQSNLLVTNFEPFHARSTFPCFDEPSFKAKFQLNLVVPNSSYTAISNMPVIQNYSTSYGHVYKFETTPLMPSYILAFAISQYNYTEINDGKISIKAYSHRANDSCNTVMKYSAKALDFFSKYTNFSYPLPKIDLIEYDRTTSLATENWGLITCNTGIISSKNNSYIDYLQFQVITHEIAHYWFGNLVTNDWWNDLWLQEGFAVFMTLKGEEHIKGNNAVREFPIIQLYEIYKKDQKEKITPIVYFGETPTAVMANFEDIAYVKGAVVLIMTEMILGEEKFQQAVQTYISRYAYNTATTSDFIEIIEQFQPDKANIRGFMETYLYQNRYPVIDVTETDDYYALKQFSCSDYENDVDSPYRYKWTIPVTYVTSENQRNSTLVWFDNDMDILKIPKRNETWIYFNYQEKGLYHTIYSDSLWNKLIEHGQDMDINVKSHLFLQAVQLFDADLISCNTALQYIVELFKNNKREFPVKIEYYTLAFMILKKKIISFDESAFEYLKNYNKVLFIMTGYERLLPKPNEDTGSETTKKTNTEPSEKTLSCIKWIKDNLSNYYYY